jgi:hypothetical protein
MNRHMVSMAMVLLLGVAGTADARTAARVEYRDGRIGLAVVIGDLPVRVIHQQPRAAGWIAADLGPTRVVVSKGRPAWTREALRKNDLQRQLGKSTVRMLERHARSIGLRGPLRGEWYRIDRRTVVLEVTVRGAPVAEFYDYGGNGVFERMYLARAPRPYR